MRSVVIFALVTVISAVLFDSLGSFASAQTLGHGAPAVAAARLRQTLHASELDRTDLEGWFDGVVPYALQINDIAGAVVVIVKGDEVLFEKGYGYADVANRVPMDAVRTGVGVGSVSKVFTWTAVMQLVQAHKLDLDRNVNDYIDFKIPDAFGRPITLRDLMTHTAGFEEQLKTYLTSGSKPKSLRDYLRSVPPPERIFPPGTIPAYSNYGATLAGYIVQRVSGEDFPAYIEHHILSPLQMVRSTFQWPRPGPINEAMAKYYGLASSGQPLPASANIEDTTVSPAGSFVSTADDMSHFIIAHLQSGQFDGNRILAPETMRLMHTTAFVPLPGAQGVALGLFRNDINGHKILMHDGDLSGFHTDLEMLPDDQIGYFLSVNSDGRGDLLPGADAMRASVFKLFMDRYFPAVHEVALPTWPSAHRDSRIAAGEYEMSRRPHDNLMVTLYLAAHIAISANDDGTIETPGLISLATGRPQTWREIGPFVWQEVHGRARLVMRVKNDHVKEWLPNDITSSFVLQPVSWQYSRTVNLALLAAAVIIIFLHVILWPIATLVRRRYGVPLDISARELRTFRLSRLAALAGAAFLLGWVALVIAVISGFPFDAALDPWIRVIQAIGLIATLGTCVCVWNAWLTWAGKRALWVKICSVALALALADLAWFSFAFGLISASLNY